MTNEDSEAELNRTLQKIGRNVLQFQRMEVMLKTIVARSTLQGDLSGLKEQLNKSKKRLSEQTMGGLIREYVDKVYSNEADYEGEGQGIVETISMTPRDLAKMMKL